MNFKGISRVFSTVNSQQYETIAGFGMNCLKYTEERT